MAVGKMSTSLEIYRAAKTRGIKTEFVATGQGGIAIVGQGIPLDAVRVDFAAGAVEGIVMKLGQECDLLLVEGQGSLIHPGSTATLPLIRGSQPTGLILVHRAGQKHIHNLPYVLIPPLPEVIQLYETVASAGGTFGKVRVKAIALNTFHLDKTNANKAIEETSATNGTTLHRCCPLWGKLSSRCLFLISNYRNIESIARDDVILYISSFFLVMKIVVYIHQGFSPVRGSFFVQGEIQTTSFSILT